MYPPPPHFRQKESTTAYGLPPGWRSEYARLLKEQYGIEMRTVALCIVSETLCSYVDSYDEISAAAANRKFGHDVFNECAKQPERIGNVTEQ